MAGLAKHPPVYLPEVSALLGLLHIMFGIKESGIAVADPEQYLYFGYPFFPYMVNRLVLAFHAGSGNHEALRRGRILY